MVKKEDDVEKGLSEKGNIDLSAQGDVGADISPEDEIELSEDEQKRVREDLSEIDKEISLDDAALDKASGVSDTAKIMIIIGIIILLFGAGLLYSYYKNSNTVISGESYNYNGFNFEKQGIIWRTMWVNEGVTYNISMNYGPKELELVPISGKLGKKFNQSKVYVTFDPDDQNLSVVGVAATEIAMNLRTAFNYDVVAACAKNITGECENRPIVDCNSEWDAVIYVRSSPRNEVVLSGNCLIVQGTDKGIVKSAERILYVWYGIMPLNLTDNTAK